MNATQWETLTDFTKWLGREGKNKTYLNNSSYVAPFQGERVSQFNLIRSKVGEKEILCQCITYSMFYLLNVLFYSILGK